MKIAIVGAGGHATVVGDILLRMREAGDRVELVAFVEERRQPERRTLLTFPVVTGGLSALADIPHDAVIVAVGDNAARRQLAEQLRRSGVLLAIARHPSSVLAPDVDIGPGTVVCAGAVVNPGSRVGSCAIVNTLSSVDHHGAIGQYVHLAPGVRLGGDVTIGDETLVGIGATVMPQLRVGRRVIVGAGSLVTRDLPDNVTVVGSPARVRTSGARAAVRAAAPDRER